MFLYARHTCCFPPTLGWLSSLHWSSLRSLFAYMHTLCFLRTWLGLALLFHSAVGMHHWRNHDDFVLYYLLGITLFFKRSCFCLALKFLLDVCSVCATTLPTATTWSSLEVPWFLSSSWTATSTTTSRLSLLRCVDIIAIVCNFAWVIIYHIRATSLISKRLVIILSYQKSMNGFVCHLRWGPNKVMLCNTSP